MEQIKTLKNTLLRCKIKPLKNMSRISYTAKFDNDNNNNCTLSTYPVYFIKYPINQDEINKLKIPNLRIIHNNSLRGEALSSKKNRWALKKIKALGIESVIDLREKYVSQKYSQLCQKEGLKYFNFPIDSSSVSDDIIIQNFPLMFHTMNNGRYYIACAQGLHRTDIALALNYVFNPKCTQIPIMSGHYQDRMEIEDIKRRINSISKKITDNQLKKLGWKNNAQLQIQIKKNKLYDSFNDNKPQDYYK